METHMDKPCEICGDDGYAELIATCIECNATREHVYCMSKICKEGPQDWVCESCSSPESARKEEALVSPHVVNNEGERLPAPSKVHYTSSLQAHSKKLKHADTSKVKFIPTEEVIRLSSGGTTKTNFSPKRVFSNFKAPMSRRTPIKSKILTPISPVKKPPRYGSMHLLSRIDQNASQNFKETRDAKEYGSKKELNDVLPAKDSKANEDKGTHKASCASSKSTHYLSLTSTGKRADVASISEHGGKNSVDAIVTSSKVETDGKMDLNKASNTAFSSGGNICNAAEQKNADVQERELANILPFLHLYRTYLPALRVTWKGSFTLGIDTSGESLGAYQAQPPSSVHLKAYKFAQTMPAVLNFKLLPQFQLFRNSCLDLQDIALYFFPVADIERSGWLFEHMEIQNLMMRSRIKDIELLIFTSKQLNVDSRNVMMMLKTERFLCGVFHSVRTVHDKFSFPTHSKEYPFPNLECASGDRASSYDSGTVDMDIDMVGGKNVGRVDMIVRKDPSTHTSTGPAYTSEIQS